LFADELTSDEIFLIFHSFDPCFTHQIQISCLVNGLQEFVQRGQLVAFSKLLEFDEIFFELLSAVRILEKCFDTSWFSACEIAQCLHIKGSNVWEFLLDSINDARLVDGVKGDQGGS